MFITYRIHIHWINMFIRYDINKLQIICELWIFETTNLANLFMNNDVYRSKFPALFRKMTKKNINSKLIAFIYVWYDLIKK